MSIYPRYWHVPCQPLRPICLNLEGCALCTLSAGYRFVRYWDLSVRYRTVTNLEHTPPGTYVWLENVVIAHTGGMQDALNSAACVSWESIAAARSPVMPWLRNLPQTSSTV